MESSGAIFQVLFLGMVFISGCRCQNRGAPIFRMDMNNYAIKEDTPIGTSVYTLEAYDPEDGSTNMVYTTDAGMFDVGSISGVVTLSRALDFEGEKEMTFIITARNRRGQETRMEITVTVSDVNDNNPSFSKDTYSKKLRESSPIGTYLDTITITDVDYVNAPLSLLCEDKVGEDVCSKFEAKSVGINSNRKWTGQILTKEVLDYETSSVYQIPFIAFDGLHKTSKSFEVIIEDVPDTPPYFVKAYSVTRNEGLEVNENVTDVIAKDGDKKNPRPIRYEIYNPSVPGVFTIEPKTGIIKTLKKLDRESLTLPYVTLYIRAREVIAPGPPESLGNDPSTTATASIRVNILDINDEVPVFDNTNYNVTIFENHKDNTGIGVTLTVTDRDQGSAGQYSLRLLNENSRFAVFPEDGQSKFFAYINVINTSLIDYETMGPQKRYILRVTTIEKERNVLGLPVQTATVTVNILDVNDNSPRFTATRYETQVDEMAPSGTVVIDTINVIDPDTGILGKDGVRFSLIGSGSNKFSIHPSTGVVSVSPCQGTPGETPCIDFETKQQYDLTVIAEDELGNNGRRSNAPLRIKVLNANDNEPSFGIGNYESDILEGDTRPNPVIQFQVSDRDRTTDFTYAILQEDVPGLWRVDASDKLVATRGVKYSETPSKLGRFLVLVTASDGRYTATATATINVEEANNYDPEFDAGDYSETIFEETPGGTSILTISATDKDPANTPAGQIRGYEIMFGGQGKFTINKDSGILSTSSDATFDKDLQASYTMVVSVSDKFEPSRSARVNVVIYIKDSNNKNPYLVPLTHRQDISEAVPVGTHVINITAKDPDENSRLEFEFIEPIYANNPEGVPVDKSIYDYTQLFRIVRTTGEVKVNRKLDRDSASMVTFTVRVWDMAASPPQNGTGKLIINILEYNDQPPEFEAPWTKNLPFYNINVREELPIGSWVRTLIAIDEDDSISEYKLTSVPEFFNVESQTGIVTVRNRMDFEKVETAVFTVEAYDSGKPRLTATATIYVNITNENDNSPLFQKNSYKTEIYENSPPGTFIADVSASDLDKGDYGVVRYRIFDDRFSIDPITGRINVSGNANLDREKEAMIPLQVEAYDSPNMPANFRDRRYNFIQVYITLKDENDNDPRFTSDEFKGLIVETLPRGRSVLKVTCADPDEGFNADVRYFRDPSQDRGLFKLDSKSGQFTVGTSLLGKAGTYSFTVYCEDEQATGPTKRKGEGLVTIVVMKATNSPPLWIVPARENMTAFAFEEQYYGMMVYQVKAIDYDEDVHDGRVTYGFYIGNKFTDRTGQFRINPTTGVIQAEIVYDRERVDSYRLLLVARDNGNPFLESTRFLTVKIRDVNDHLPRFPMENGQTTPYTFYATENNDDLPVVVGKVTAIDEDLAQYADIFYYIVEGNVDNAFSIGLKTGEISMVQAVDREKQAEINLVVMATNNISDYTVIRNRRKRSADPNVVTVNIRIRDLNDEKPVFKQENYYGCVNVDARYDQSIVRVEAEDKDALGSAVIVYRFIDGNEGNQFAIKSGVVSNKKLMRNYKDMTFNLVVEAADSEDPKTALTATSKVKVFVTEEDNEVKLVLAQPATEVRLFVNQIQRVLAEQFSDDIKYVCILDVKDHVIDEVGSDSSQIWSDVYVAAADDTGTLFSTDALLHKLNEKQDKFNILHVKYIEPAKTDRSLIDETPVLAVLILVVILIILALIILICACYCIYKSKEDRLKKSDIERHHIIKSEQPLDDSPVVVAAPAQEPIMIENTAYDNAVFIPDPDPEPPVIESKREEEPVPVIVTEVEPEPWVEPEPEPEPVYSVVDKGSRPTSDVDQIPPEIETKQIDIEVDDSPLPSPIQPQRESFVIETDVLDK